MSGDAATRRTGRALVELTRRPEVRRAAPADVLDGVDPTVLVTLAAYHRVPGTVYRSLVGGGVDPAPYADLRSAVQMAVLSHARTLGDLAVAGRALDDAGIGWLVVKGPVLVALAYGDPGARLYEDVDLLVAPGDLPAALAALEGAGGRVADVNWPLLARSGRAELPLVLAGGTPADLHWDLLVTPGIRARFRLPRDEVVARARTVTVDGRPLVTPDAVDTLLYLCLHGSLSGGHQLVWLADLDRTVVAEPPDWDEVVDRARRWGADLVAAVQLDRARDVLGTPVPPEAVDRLAGRSWWAAAWRRRERAAGTARWGGLSGTGRTVVAATSSDTAASVVQLARSLVVDVARPWAAGLVGGRTGGGGPALYRAVGGEAGRRALLDQVVAGHRR